jgi:hypothetical protein
MALVDDALYPQRDERRDPDPVAPGRPVGAESSSGVMTCGFAKA